MKKHIFAIICSVIYFVILFVAIGCYVENEMQKKHFASLKLSMSSWLSDEQNNMIMVQATDSQADAQFDHHIVRVGYYDEQATGGSIENLPKDGKLLFRLTDFGKYASKFSYLYFELWDASDPTSLLNPPVSRYGDYYSPLDPPSIYDGIYSLYNEAYLCREFIDDESIFIDDLGSFPYTFPFEEGNYNASQPGTELSVITPSSFIPGLPNEVLFVDIHDGEPYQGNIQVTQQNLPGATEPFDTRASSSGVTSLNMTLQNRGDFVFNAGDDRIEVSFDPAEYPFHIRLDSDHISNVYRPHAHVTHSGESKYIYIDYFVGYAWISRQVVPADRTTLDIELNPDYKFNVEYEPEIIYARFSTSGFLEKGKSQTIPLIAKLHGNPNNYSDDENLSLEFSAIFMAFIKIHKINEYSLPRRDYTISSDYRSNYIVGDVSNVMRNKYLQRTYPIFVVAPIIKSGILDKSEFKKNIVRCANNGVDAADLPDECLDFNPSDYKPLDYNQIRKYLMAQLARQHHPKIKVFERQSIELLRGIFEKKKLEKSRNILIFLMCWCLVGILPFTVAARRIRNRRQQAWFDDASRGGANGVMPGTPLILMVLIAFLFVVLISSACYFMIKL